MLESTGKSNASSCKLNTRVASGAKRPSICATTVKQRCFYCNEEHSVYHCPNFLALAVSQRIAEICKAKICVNCLRSTTHIANKCTSGNCRVCKLKHHTLLHLSSDASKSPANNQGPNEGTTPIAFSTTVVTYTSAPRRDECVMLATAVVHA